MAEWHTHTQACPWVSACSTPGTLRVPLISPSPQPYQLCGWALWMRNLRCAEVNILLWSHSWAGRWIQLKTPLLSQSHLCQPGWAASRKVGGRSRNIYKSLPLQGQHLRLENRIKCWFWKHQELSLLLFRSRFSSGGNFSPVALLFFSVQGIKLRTFALNYIPRLL